jgi:predicted dehydrogenase
MVVGPRYNASAPFAGTPAPAANGLGTPGAMPADGVNPPVLKPGMRNGHDISLAVSLNAGVPVRDMKIINHQASLNRTGDASAQVVLDPKDSVPNKDFVLRYAVAGEKPGMALLPYADSANGGYFMLMIQPAIDKELEKAPPREVVFLVDVSGSMGGQPTEQVKRTMSEFFKRSKPTDTLQVITFAGETNKLFEKPVAVDPPGVRRVIAAGKEAQGKGLCLVAGTQRRHQSNYLKNKYAIDNGAIGKIMSGQVSWCGGALWVRPREAGQTDADYLVNNWGNFAGMSGDHIVEQHIHNIDVANWFIGRHPQQAIGFGGRARRKTGDQYDFFDVDFDYGENLHIHSMCRQVNGCYSRVDEFFEGTEGTTFGGGKMESAKLASMNIPAFETHPNGQVQEHIDLLKAILESKPNSETEATNVATSTLTVIMGRISAYTGQVVRWTDLMEKQDSPLYNLTMLPTAEDFEKGPVTAPKDDVVPIPGSDTAPRRMGMGKGKGKGKGKKKANAAA